MARTPKTESLVPDAVPNTADIIDVVDAYGLGKSCMETPMAFLAAIREIAFSGDDSPSTPDEKLAVIRGLVQVAEQDTMSLHSTLGSEMQEWEQRATAAGIKLFQANQKGGA